MALLLPAMLTGFTKKVDKSYKLTFETTQEYTNDGALDKFHLQAIWLTLSESQLSEESIKAIEATPTDKKVEKYSPSQKLRFAAESLRKRLNSNTDKEEFYRACVQTFIDQLNKKAL